jgi:hypothetical protein
LVIEPFKVADPRAYLRGLKVLAGFEAKWPDLNFEVAGFAETSVARRHGPFYGAGGDWGTKGA